MKLSTKNKQELNQTINALQRQAFAVVQNSLHDGFGNSILEAMWKEKIVIVSSTSGLRDLVKENVEGLQIKDSSDPISVAKSIAKAVLSN